MFEKNNKIVRIRETSAYDIVHAKFKKNGYVSLASIAEWNKLIPKEKSGDFIGRKNPYMNFYNLRDFQNR